MSAYVSRKRAASYMGGAVSKKRRYTPKKRILRPIPRYLLGRVRTGGYYGRFAGRSAELKFFDTALAWNFDSTGEVPATGQLALIPQGVTESTRIGRACVVKSIQIRGNFVFQPTTAASAATTVILLVVQDTQCNGAAAAVTDVLNSANMSTALINIDNSQRFKILKRITVSMNASAGVTTAYNNVVRHVDMYKKCYIPLDFSSTTGALTEIRSNNIFLLAGSDGASDDLVSFGGYARLRFSDSS